MVFRKKDKIASRKALNLPVDDKVIAFGAQKITTKNPWKGGKDLIEILKRINAGIKQTIHLLIIGEGEPNVRPTSTFVSAAFPFKGCFE